MPACAEKQDGLVRKWKNLKSPHSILDSIYVWVPMNPGRLDYLFLFRLSSYQFLTNKQIRNSKFSKAI